MHRSADRRLADALGVDEADLGDGDDDDDVAGTPEPGEELEPLAVAEEVDAEETAPLEEADGDAPDDGDDDVRPEDQY